MNSLKAWKARARDRILESRVDGFVGSRNKAGGNRHGDSGKGAGEYEIVPADTVK